MRTTFLFILVVTTQLCFAQQNRVAVAGTKVSMVPPEGFIPGKSFAGFQQEASGSSIMVSELPMSTSKVITSFEPSALQAKGMALIAKDTVAWQGSKTTLIRLSQIANGETYYKEILVFGDSTRSILIAGIFPKGSTAVQPAIRAALLSARYEQQQPANTAAALPFTINTSGSEFKFVKFLGGSSIYTLDGKLPTASPEKAAFMISSSLGGKVTGDQLQFATQRIKSLPGAANAEVRKTDSVSIDGKHGLALEATSQKGDGSATLIYQVILFEPTGEYYMLVGSTVGRKEELLTAFKILAKTFKVK